MIVINHVLEHLSNGNEIFSRLCSLLAPEGVLYAEFPSIRTAYKRKTKTSYHFHDDPTHKTFYIIENLANMAIFADCKIVSCGPVSTKLKNWLSSVRACIAWVSGKPYEPYLLHKQKKIDHILLRRNKGN